MTVSFNPLAARELYDAAQYYDLESEGLGLAFIAEVQRNLQLIHEHPEVGQIVRGTVRRSLLRRFPYALLYSRQADTIRILAVMNLKRRPSYWVGRT